MTWPGSAGERGDGSQNYGFKALKGGQENVVGWIPEAQKHSTLCRALLVLNSLQSIFFTGIPPFGDPHTPDIIVQAVPGVITRSHKQQEEHGGFDHNDTNLIILVANPCLHAKRVDSFVENSSGSADHPERSGSIPIG